MRKLPNFEKEVIIAIAINTVNILTYILEKKISLPDLYFLSIIFMYSKEQIKQIIIKTEKTVLFTKNPVAESL